MKIKWPLVFLVLLLLAIFLINGKAINGPPEKLVNQKPISNNVLIDNYKSQNIENYFLYESEKKILPTKSIPMTPEKVENRKKLHGGPISEILKASNSENPTIRKRAYQSLLDNIEENALGIHHFAMEKIVVSRLAQENDSRNLLLLISMLGISEGDEQHIHNVKYGLYSLLDHRDEQVRANALNTLSLFDQSKSIYYEIVGDLQYGTPYEKNLAFDALSNFALSDTEIRCQYMMLKNDPDIEYKQELATILEKIKLHYPLIDLNQC